MSETIAATDGAANLQNTWAEGLEALAEPIDSLQLLQGNPRVGDVDAVAASLRRFGQRKPVVARRDDRVVIAGNHTLQAARQLGWDEIAVVWVDDDETAKAFALADNRTGDLGSYDDEALAVMIQEVRDFDAELLADTGWHEDDVDELLASLEPTVLPAMGGDADAIPDSAPAKTVAGDVWLLGPHRVMCGDATDPGAIERLLDGETADMVWADPPYGIGYEAMRGGASIANDASAVDALAVTTAALAETVAASAHFICCDWRSLPTTKEAMEVAGLTPKACVIWDKKVRVQNLDRFAKRHEMILYAGPYGGEPTVDTDVWEIPRDFDPDHPTPKPVELVATAIRHASTPGAIILDPFAGSGPSLIAAHQTGRVARLIELDPHYVDVICRRYQEATGDLPIAESTGRPHDFTQEA